MVPECLIPHLRFLGDKVLLPGFDLGISPLFLDYPLDAVYVIVLDVVLIRRAAEVAHDPHKSRDTIKLSDLPALV